MEWITGELRGFRRIKLSSTETVPCAGLDALEPYNFDDNLLVTYCWVVHSRYQLKSHSAFSAQQQRGKLSLPITARKAEKEYLFYLAKIEVTICTLSAP